MYFIESIMCFLVGMEFWAVVNWARHFDNFNAKAAISNLIAIFMCVVTILIIKQL